MSLCPLCQRPISRTGAYLASADHAGRWFTFQICVACRVRQGGLPKRVQQRQDVTAARSVLKHPERYEVKIWGSSYEARLYARLSADALRVGWEDGGVPPRGQGAPESADAQPVRA